MPNAADMQQQARENWVRAGALSKMFARRSRSTGVWSNVWLWVSIGLGFLTGIAGLATLNEWSEKIMAAVTGVLGVMTATLNTVREKFLPAEREGELWGFRNSTAKLQDRFGDLYVSAMEPGTDQDETEAFLKAAISDLREIEAAEHANRVLPEDETCAKQEFEDSPRFAMASPTQPDVLPAAPAQPEQPEQPEGALPAGMTRVVRGGAP